MDYKTDKETHKLNVYGYIDYKQPLGKHQDMRTSTYLGSKPMTDTMLGDKIHARFKESRPYTEDSVLDQQRISDYKANYLWKYGDPDEVRNPTVDRIDFVKPFYECQMKFLKRPMLPASSVAHSDYLWHPQPPTAPPSPIPMPAPVATTKVNMDRAKPGYTKYLDPAATTSRLDFYHRSPQDIMSGIGAMDSITFWNWQSMERRTKKVFRQHDPQQCDNMPASECVKRRCEFPSMVKAVPHSGLTTEVRENYVEPYKRASEYDSTKIRNALAFVEAEPSAERSEYGILGSGECTRKYV